MSDRKPIDWGHFALPIRQREICGYKTQIEDNNGTTIATVEPLAKAQRSPIVTALNAYNPMVAEIEALKKRIAELEEYVREMENNEVQVAASLIEIRQSLQCATEVIATQAEKRVAALKAKGG